jgi:hypothetical protein
MAVTPAAAAPTAAVVTAAAAEIAPPMDEAKDDPAFFPAELAAGSVAAPKSFAMVACEPSILGMIVTVALATSIMSAMSLPFKEFYKFIMWQGSTPDLLLPVFLRSGPWIWLRPLRSLL